MTAATAFLLLILVSAPASQETRVSTTILNTSVVKVDRPGRTLTVRVDAGTDDGVDRDRTRKLPVAASAAAGLARLKPGSEVLLTLRGDTVVDIKLSAGGGGGSGSPARRPAGGRSVRESSPPPRRVIVVSPAPPAAGGPQQAIPQLPPGATSPTNRNVPQLPAGADPPQGRPVPQVPTGGVLVISGSPSPSVSPVGVAPTRPAVSPVAVRSPRSPGTPKPVILPSDHPPSPVPG